MVPKKASDQPERFFNEGPSEWAQIKHKILSGYLRVFVYKLQRASDTILVVDGFAGAGRYADGSPGSPLLAVELNQDLAMKDRGIAINVHAIEQDPECVKSLQEALQPWTRVPQRAWVMPGGFADYVDEIAARSAGIPTFIFLDPFGAGVTIDSLQPLLNSVRSAPLELLLRVDATLLTRFAGQVRKGRDHPEYRQTAEAFADLLKRMNIDPDVISDSLEDRRQWLRHRRREVVLSRYQAAFAKRFAYAQYLPVRPTHGAAPKYYLLHVSESPHGYVMMNDVVSKLLEGQDLQEQSRKQNRSGQGNLFAPVPSLRIPDSEIDSALLDAAEAKGSRGAEFIEIRAALVRRFGTTLRQKDHNAALKRLRDSGRLEIGPVTNSNYDRAIVRFLRR
ncbi:MAG TPA: hypothetical protein DGD08_01915 [Gemmatimonas aurantiaca]|uniref:Three-Cys-motif partner protein TcmP n=2 Tax=Gemmatimonas aurantiaca TaxID=173480 RepID=C1AAR4_GEMAT|nr:three-Cys-motif partner protein TcmP [Gemmatimonas aurantiaca]BAH39320.1 hypothetical protein GAU_2278 [Gemmatimonas aurantiaca T-27]HCT55950.1 hypothetical protein [Gemmatimonas aurantiaca]